MSLPRLAILLRWDHQPPSEAHSLLRVDAPPISARRDNHHRGLGVQGYFFLRKSPRVTFSQRHRHVDYRLYLRQRRFDFNVHSVSDCKHICRQHDRLSRHRLRHPNRHFHLWRIPRYRRTSWLLRRRPHTHFSELLQSPLIRIKLR